MNVLSLFHVYGIGKRPPAQPVYPRQINDADPEPAVYAAAVLTLAVFSRAVIDRHFPDRETGDLEQGREKPVSVSEETNRLQAVPLENPQGAPYVGDAVPQNGRPDLVRYDARYAAHTLSERFRRMPHIMCT